MNALQTAQELVVRTTRRCHHLENRLEGSAVQLLVDLVSVEVHSYQTEQANVHGVCLAHATDHVRQAGGGKMS